MKTLTPSGILHKMFSISFILFSSWLLLRFISYHRLFRDGLLEFSLVLILFLVPFFIQTRLNHQKYLVFFIVLASVFVRMIWCFLVQTQPISDFLTFWEKAYFVAQGLSSIFESKAPASILYYSMMRRLVDEVWLAYVANSALAGLQVWLVYRMVWMLTRNERSWVASYLYAFYPGGISFTSVISSEVLMMTFILLTVYFFFSIMYETDSLVVLKLILCGLCCGVAYLSRNVSLLYLLIMGSVLWMIPKPKFTMSKRMIMSVLITFSFAVTVFPQVVWNYEKYGMISITSNPWGDIVLLFGTSQATNGTYNKAEVMSLYQEGKRAGESLDHLAIMQKAKEEAISRILLEPWRFLHFALGEKFDRMWANDHLLSWSTKESPLFKEGKHRTLFDFLHGVHNAYYFYLWCFALVGVILALRSNHWGMILMTGFILITFVFHLFYEVQPRYHLPVMPFVCILASTCYHSGLLRSV